ncbi:MAG TPA: deoxyguanosinetriphosphate triphosphohydrolase [Nitrospira sp.]|nr:deoxyguanosinetriphosphate triphosphohydrolase [Nitrospira sp.]
MGKSKAKSSDPPVMSWKKLLSEDRLKPIEQTSGARSPFVVDQDIVINSQPFRRLQDKTQVHPLSDNDHVRRRLTHSLEVASIGRALGKCAAKRLLQNHQHLAEEGVSPETFGEILYAACLAHDIGNPPFGHFGETAIQTALNKMIESPLCMDLNEQEKGDLGGWEGNAHGFRVLNTLEKYQDDGGMRLTVATLATFAKYPWSSVSQRGKANKGKFGYFQCEQAAFSQIAQHVGLLEDPSGGWCRHPLAHLVEAADDIAYAVGDLEDGCELKLVSFDEIKAIFKDIRYRDEVTDSRRSERRRLEFLREDVVQNAVEDVAETFCKKHTDLLAAGRLPEGILPLSRVGGMIKKAKERATEKIFQAPQKAGIEVASFEVIGTLIEKIVTALLTIRREGKGSREHRRLIEFSLNKKIDWIIAQPPFELLITTADYVAGMTDSYALRMYRHMKGIDFSVGR